MGKSAVSENAVRRYYELVDQGDVDGLVGLFHPDAVYHRPGYPPLHGEKELLDFYSSQRVIKEGRHTITTLVANGAEVAVHGEFAGTLHSGETAETRFADFFHCDSDGMFTRRDTFFFVPRI